MKRWRAMMIKATLFVLGLTPVLKAAASTGGPTWCPPFDAFLTPTWLDVFIYPGFTGR